MTGIQDPGEFVEVAYPFIREVYGHHGGSGEAGDGYIESLSWRPGTRMENTGGPDGASCDSFADGMGYMSLMVVSVHKPGEFPTRVFYLREWIDPEGHRFGKKRRLRMTTASAFKALCRGYRHPFVMKPQVEAATSLTAPLG